ncbi:uncharacterized protein LOC132271198 [Cornus florida]|uniref:uncharacterized protein LOC132271198 n=1 Tax=Cornus florida TaxID=4283 RepID=UPI002896B5A9|nr:uncharacterized protein LOC132271198 [Cornus florida]
MGCFFACFNNSKNRKSRKLQDKVSSGNQSQEEPHEALQPTNNNSSNLIIEPKSEHEELSDTSTKKKVTFDLNVETDKELSSQEPQCCLAESKFERERGNKEETQNERQILLGSNVSIRAYDPPNHGYHNCTSSDDECVDMDLEESDSDGPHGHENDNSDQALLVQEEESSESLFSISIGKRNSAAEMGSKEVNSPITIRDSIEEGLNSVGLNQHVLPAAEVGSEGVNSPITIRDSPEELTPVGLNQSGRNKSQQHVLSAAEMCSEEVNSPITIRDSIEEGLNFVGLNQHVLSAAEMGSEGVNSPITIRDSPEELRPVGLNHSGRNKSQQHVLSAAEMGSEEVNSPITIRDLPEGLRLVGLNQSGRSKSQQHVLLSVLSPVENLTQWKVVKAKTTTPPLEHQDKENITYTQHELNIPSSEEPSFRLQIHKSRRRSKSTKPEDEIAVDTSLSSWLVESELTETAQKSLNSIGTSSAERANSAVSFEDRPILGAMTVDELKKLSEFSSPRQSPRRHCSPDEMPIIGTVGSYWSHTGHTVDSESSSCSSSRGMSYTSKKYREV